MKKSSLDEIRQRFDADVERFSNLETGQTSTVDAALAMALACDAAIRAVPNIQAILDIGCGAGNYSLSLLQRCPQQTGTLPSVDVTLADLSEPMLARAKERVSAVTAGTVQTKQGDIREIDLGVGKFDVILAAAVLHHLREDADWHAVFKKCFAALKPGGTFWIVDLVTHDIPAVQSLLWERYGDYLVALKGPEYRDHVFDYIGYEDTPRSVPFQMDALRKAGFRAVEVLHKNTCFATIGAVA
ncbi:MAG: class I SAM-dependent methyltransferase [Puniceicoccales bacterium]|jgi:tRNA (cmo5U34)-methyltransferase|nr:class I SAM-dependent methyltransferase [Puniceicoccales bacterium]